MSEANMVRMMRAAELIRKQSDAETKIAALTESIAKLRG